MRADSHQSLGSTVANTVQLDRAVAGLRAVFRYLSRPAVLPILQAAIAVLLVLWLLSSLWRALWSFVPVAPPLAVVAVLNPVSSAQRDLASVLVDIDALTSAQLFGRPGTTLSPEELAAGSGRSPTMSESEAARKLAGIEDGAPDTRLPLVLRGVVASSDAGLGQAVIEHSKRQDLYQVADELPVNGEVTLAKVLPSLVVIDNGGRYEILRLFEDDGLSARNKASMPSSQAPAVQAPAAQAPAVQAPAVQVPALTRAAEQTTSGSLANADDAAEIAARYRDQLYRDPQSLSDVVRISPAREGDRLVGYRLAPGAVSGEFSALGFQMGDVVTAVNGLSVSEASNIPTLFSAMRSADAASFDIQRKGETVTLTVDIGQSRQGVMR
ncbi:MAG: type II secretion system protein GspC [Congregibacter sp.]